MQKQTSPALTPASAWKARAAGEIKKLPSGVAVRVKRPSLFALARTGHVPNPLAAEVIKYLALTEEPKTPPTPDEEITNYRENAAIYASIAAVAVTEPRIILDKTPDYDAGEIAPEDLSTADLIWIYTYVVAGITTDDPFQGSVSPDKS